MTAADFYKKVDTSRGPENCWPFLYADGKAYRTYGRVYLNGKTWLAHRASWAISNGPIPDGLCVLHKCDRPPCVNPAHLFLGTQAENLADMVAKGRHGLTQKLYLASEGYACLLKRLREGLEAHRFATKAGAK